MARSRAPAQKGVAQIPARARIRGHAAKAASAAAAAGDAAVVAAGVMAAARVARTRDDRTPVARSRHVRTSLSPIRVRTARAARARV